MEEYKTPYYFVYEEKLRRNIELITGVAERTGVDIIMAFKANALWRTFDVFREYGIESTASSVNEMLLAIDELKCRTHTYCPAYTDETIDAYIAGSSHITFNSVEQYLRFADKVKQHNADWPGEQVSCGLRVNPMCSEKVLLALKQQFGKYLPRLKWLNMGGGHLMTRKGYNIKHLEQVLGAFQAAYPDLQIILEPGSAWCWQTGDLEASVVDVVTNSGITTAIVDVSFACHMPDCLEMPYQPKITQALDEVDSSKPTYRMGGNSCSSGLRSPCSAVTTSPLRT